MFSASPDATIRIWSVPNASCVQVVRAHESAVTGLSLHATGDYLLSSSDDQVWSRPGPRRGLWSPRSNILAGGNTSPLPPPRPSPQSPRGEGVPTFSLAPLSLCFQYWAFSDIQTGRVLTKVTDETSGCCKLPQRRWALSLPLPLPVCVYVSLSHLLSCP